VDSIFRGLDARSIGPAGTSGRVSAIAISPRDERIAYVGAATGGLWRSPDGGFTWSPLMDDLSVSSIGAIAVSPATPHTLWVGTGEGSTRNSMGVGRGIWKSEDDGKTWRHVGLAETERIEKIRLHPADPDVAWVSALGPAWSDGEERGVFKTTDGGESWRKVLYVSERTGAFDLVVDPSNPDHLLASTWEYRRWPWFFESGGPGSGLWESWDGGETWERQGPEDGLPRGDLGRIGLAFSPGDPDVAYALVEAEESALLRSEDGGRSWKAVNTDTNVNPRAFYYSRIAVDPTNENRVYRISGDLDMSEDGGRTFETIAPWESVHVDNHTFWASPDGTTLWTGNDGGVFITHDRGGAWRFVENLPLSQFYHLSVDHEVPFNVYGGLQDNGSWRGPSQVWEQPSFAGANVVSHHWRTIGFGDGFAALSDPTDPTLGYSQSQGGFLRRFDLETNETELIRPPAPDSATELRFNWNAGIALDPFDPEVIYYGSQFVHRSPDRGETWEIISPDLTTDDPEKQRQAESGGLTHDVTNAENHTTILVIAPSPLERGVLWVGTDDGNVQLTRDGGETWTNVVDRIPGVPEATWVPHIEASAHDPATAYVVFDDHRRGNWTPYVFRTRDYGESWQALSPEQIDGFIHTLEEDPEEPNLLFLGTEFGLYVSLDAGAEWRKWIHGGYPAGVPTREVVVHPRDADLAVGTHGRGAWIVDDIRPLRAVAAAPGIAERPLHLFEIPPAIQHNRGMTGPFYFPGDTRYEGENRPYGALVSYSVSPGVAEAAAEGEEDRAEAGGGEPEGGGSPFGPQGSAVGTGPATLEILEGDSVIRTLRGPAEAGVNRRAWGLERRGIPTPGAPEDAPEPTGPEVLPGTYGVRVTVGDHTAEGTVEVRPDPRREKSIEVLRANLDAYWRGQERMAELRGAVRRLEETREALDLAAGRLEGWDGGDEAAREDLAEATDSVRSRVSALLERLRVPDDTKGIVKDTTMTSRLGGAINEATGTPYAPSEGRLRQMEWTMRAAARLLGEIEAFYAEDLPAYRRTLTEAGFDLFGSGGS